MLITLSRRTAICPSIVGLQLTGVPNLGTVSQRFNFFKRPLANMFFTQFFRTQIPSRPRVKFVVRRTVFSLAITGIRTCQLLVQTLPLIVSSQSSGQRTGPEIHARAQRKICRLEPRYVKNKTVLLTSKLHLKTRVVQFPKRVKLNNRMSPNNV